MIQRPISSLASIALVATLAAGCASGAPYDVDFEDSAGVVEIVTCGDGHLLLDGERQPYEEAVAVLRRRAESMTAEQRSCTVVALRVAPVDDSRPVAARVKADLDDLLDRLSELDLKQVRLL